MASFRDRLEDAVAAGAITSPEPMLTGIGCPFASALSVVAPRPGCRPAQNFIGRRVAVGRAPTQDVADLLAMAEGVERYSIQFSTALPERLDPFLTSHGPAECVTAAELTLGAPVTARQIRSVGAAAGENRADAACRAVLELLEHCHAAAIRAPDAELAEIAPADIAGLAPHVAWLEAQLRVLRCQATICSHGYVFAACATADRDGGRRTEAFAAKLDLQGAVRHAAEEAIFAWRNMVALEHAARPLEELAPEDRAAVDRYRGAAEDPGWPLRPPSAAPEPPGLAPTDLDGLIGALARRSGQRVRLFDLSDPVLDIPVVKGHLG